ncbi:MAG: hypothetical protein O2819_07055 [Planctomycetota bacterium]|nr:hypothetical protein [Planctomycetota bacterium]MDA1106046.1 hypothetical protein [Planctomycetota bacterium]
MAMMLAHLFLVMLLAGTWLGTIVPNAGSERCGQICWLDRGSLEHGSATAGPLCRRAVRTPAGLLAHRPPCADDCAAALPSDPSWAASGRAAAPPPLNA